MSKISDMLAAEQKWQPIETATKDGTKVLAFFQRSKSIRVAWYREFLLDGWLWAYEADRNPDRWSDQPTHWMPLPPPPETP